MFVSDVSDVKFVDKVKPAFFIAKEEVIYFQYYSAVGPKVHFCLKSIGHKMNNYLIA